MYILLSITVSSYYVTGTIQYWLNDQYMGD